MTAQIIPADPNNERTLARLAGEIRLRGRRVIADVIEIGRMLTEGKKLVGHGNWLSWLEREFQWTDDTALNYMRVHDLVKNRNFRDLSNIPVSGLFLLAKPSTPETAKQEVVSRAEAGEAIPLTTVKEIVGRAKQPPPSDAFKRADAARKEKAKRDAAAALQPGHDILPVGAPLPEAVSASAGKETRAGRPLKPLEAGTIVYVNQKHIDHIQNHNSGFERGSIAKITFAFDKGCNGYHGYMIALKATIDGKHLKKVPTEIAEEYIREQAELGNFQISARLANDVEAFRRHEAASEGPTLQQVIERLIRLGLEAARSGCGAGPG